MLFRSVVHNRKYFGSVQIDMDAIEELPEDAVPIEILVGVRLEEDDSALDHNVDNYVPDIDNSECISSNRNVS